MARQRLPLPGFISADRPCHRTTTTVEVAFADTDAMGVVWHGNYLRYCERGREELGRQIGYGIARIRALGCFAPVIRSQLVHHAAARAGERVTVAVGLYPTRQPRLYHRYRLSVDDRLLVEAETEQVITDTGFVMLLQQPPELIALLQAGDADR